MQKYILKGIQRPKANLINEFKGLDVSTVYEAQGRIGLLDHYLKPILPNILIVGPAVTVTCFAGDNLMIHAAIEICEPGDILVVSTIGDFDTGMIGDLISSALLHKGVKGVVIDSGIRDVSQLKNMRFPIWSKSITSRGATKNRGGWINAPIICAGVHINPGDVVLADENGVLVVKKEKLEEILDLSKERIAREKAIREKINCGKMSLDFYNLRPVLESEGVIYCNNESEIP